MNLLLGQYHAETGEFDKAAQYLNESLKIYKDLKARLEIGEVYYHLTILASLQKKKSNAQRHLRNALEVFESIGAKSWQEKTGKMMPPASNTLK